MSTNDLFPRRWPCFVGMGSVSVNLAVVEDYAVDFGTRDIKKPIRFSHESSVSSSEIIPYHCRCSSASHCVLDCM